MCQVLDDNYYNEKYLIQMRSQAKSSGIKLPEVHDVAKNLEPSLKPEKQHTIPKQGSKERLHIGQGINQLINHPTCHRKFLEGQK